MHTHTLTLIQKLVNHVTENSALKYLNELLNKYKIAMNPFNLYIKLLFDKAQTGLNIGGQNNRLAHPTQLLGGSCPPCPLSLRLCGQSSDIDADVTLVGDGDGNNYSFLKFDDSHVTGDERSNDTELPSNVVSNSDLAHFTIERRKELITLFRNLSDCFFS
jgi:hypothetical protein